MPGVVVESSTFHGINRGEKHESAEVLKEELENSREYAVGLNPVQGVLGAFDLIINRIDDIGSPTQVAGRVRVVAG